MNNDCINNNWKIPTKDEMIIGVFYKDIRTPDLGYNVSDRELRVYDLEYLRIRVIGNDGKL